MPNEAQNYNDPMNVKPNHNRALSANIVGIGFLTFIWHFNFRI